MILDPGRFWDRVRRESEDACWPWQGSLSRPAAEGGYGRCFENGKRYPAHRVAWEEHHRRRAGKRHVRHTCHNTICCNPAHLVVGSHRDNKRDDFKPGGPRRTLRRDVERLAMASGYLFGQYPGRRTRWWLRRGFRLWRFSALHRVKAFLENDSQPTL